MKTLRNFVWMVAMTAAFIVASCSGDGTVGNKVDRFVSDDVDFVITGDISRMIAATGSTVENGAIKPGEALDGIISAVSGSAAGDIEDFLSFKGIDWTNALCAVKVKDKSSADALIVWDVTDEKEFANSFVDTVDDDLDIEEEDGYVIIGDNHTSILLKDNHGYLVIKGGNPLKTSRAINAIETWEQDASDTPLASWCKDKLAEDHILNMMVNGKAAKKFIDENDYKMRMVKAKYPDAQKLITQLTESIIVGHFDIEGKTASAEITLFDKDGNEEKVYDGGTVDAGMLKYGSKNDVFAFAAGDTKTAISKIEKYLPQLRPDETVAFNTLLGSLDGTVMVMAGPVFNSVSKWDNLQGWNITGVVGYKDAASAAKALDKVAEFGELPGAFKVSSHTAGKSMVVTVIERSYGSARYNYYTGEYEGVYEKEIPFYVKVDDKNIVVCNANKAGKGAPINGDVFEGAILGAAFDMSKDCVAMNTLNIPFGAKGGVMVYHSGIKATVTLTDTDDNFVEAILKVIGSNIN